MSAEVVIIIIGTILILLAIIDSLRSTESSNSLLSSSFRIPLGILGVILIMYGGYSYEAFSRLGRIEQVEVGNKLEISAPANQVKVISPVDGDKVRCRILTMGVYPLSLDKDIWVLLKPSDNKYYPQSDHTNTSYKRNGEWQVITRFGGDRDEPYDIIVYETDDAASRFFSKTIEEWKATLSYPGLELDEIPQSAKEVDRLTVSLQDNCRGVH